MSKKIEVIEKLITEEQVRLKKLWKVRHDIEKERIVKYTEMYSRYFKDAIMEGDTIEVSDSYVYFKRAHPDYSYHKELLSLNLKAQSWRDNEADTIETSFYSTNDNSDFELKRMVTLGRVGMVILDFRDDIIGEYNSIRDDFREPLKVALTNANHLDSKISKLSSEITAIEEKAVLDLLMTDGVEFEVDKENLRELPSLDVRWNWEVRYIKKIKILSETKSGLSAGIEIETCSNDYDYDTGNYTFNTNVRTFDKVRRDKIDHLVTWNRRKVIS